MQCLDYFFLSKRETVLYQTTSLPKAYDDGLKIRQIMRYLLRNFRSAQQNYKRKNIFFNEEITHT